jgi:uncharacterized protein (UPF0264 family)
VKALSIKQPWATLLAHGRKTIEVRPWRLNFRGPLLIHAARIADSREDAWKHVPSELNEEANQVGGIVGVGRLDDCKVYLNLTAFVTDQTRHLNDPSWFDPSGLFGLCFSELRALPFQRVKGNVKLFDVDLDDLAIDLGAITPATKPLTSPTRQRGNSSDDPLAGASGLCALLPCLSNDPMVEDVTDLRGLTPPARLDSPGLLVSVRSRAEAEAALAGGAAIIDVKEPNNGALGRAGSDVLASVLAAVGGRRPVSAALGELPVDNMDLPANLASLTFVKWGLAGWRERGSAWKDRLLRLREQVQAGSSCRVVAVAYADWSLAGAPKVLDVARFAVGNRFSVLLVDTWQKDGRTLLDWMPLEYLQGLRKDTRALGVKLALAGSLTEATIRDLSSVEPDWFAVRGAACTEGRRDGNVDVQRVRHLIDVIESSVAASRREG